MLAKKALSSTAAAPKLFVEDVFSCTLYTGTGSSQTITNNIDLAGEGGLVWIKPRTSTTFNDNILFDTARGTSVSLFTNSTAAQDTNSIGSFDSSGFSVTGSTRTNASSVSYASWTFRKAEKFFDVVTWTSTGNSNARISHNLGSVPGFYVIKQTSAAGSWFVYHRSLGRSSYIILNSTNASSSQTNVWGTSDPTSTDFGVDETFLTATGGTYVAYLFAHDAGGFGDSGSESVIKCGSFAGGGTINLGWEPQFFIWKRTDGTSDWRMHDNMRGFPTGGTQAVLAANLSSAETTNTFFDVNPTGLKHLGSGGNYIYIAIRRGPMKTPTVGSDVFRPRAQNASSTTVVPTTFPVDLIIGTQRSRATFNRTAVFDRLRGTRGVAGGGKWLATNANQSEISDYGQDIDRMEGFLDLFFNTAQSVSSSTAYWAFRRAKGFFDIATYTGTGASQTVTHNLGVVPELILIKDRDVGLNGKVYAAPLGNTKYLELFSANSANDAVTSSTVWNNTTPTATTFTIGSAADVSFSSANFMAYLFASVDGVSKVGSYTGNGSSQTVNCGFTTGARFILIKRTDNSGDWWVFDTARGIIASNDPGLRINTTTAETTTVDSIDPDNSGFIVVQNTTTNVNVSSASYIYLAIA